ncbi:uncharacterized protein LOC130445128 [Diorhabda sublineata]|uniref:uncharacterized protein LOC130445128 n=1 Tax=Diorhabda sublineata TaxID=1163346 RepID=UPI0024E1440F|nr:uncharacterized protein LOC130445128 [Diorhabda sublineata]
MPPYNAVILFLLSSHIYVVQMTSEKYNVFDKIQSGFKMASDFLSTDHASRVANLVSNALGGKSSQGNTSGKPHNVFSGFLRLFGFEPKHISAIAVNAIILIAQLISTSLNLPTKVEPKQIEKDAPFEWMLDNSIISNIFPVTQDEKLTENVIDYVKERSLDEETGCLQLLLCKMKPFIKEMQRAIKERGKNLVKGFDVLYNYFPSTDEIDENGELCEEKYYYCSVPL